MMANKKGFLLIDIMIVGMLILVLASCSTPPKQPEAVPDVVETIVTALPDSSQIPDVQGNENLPIHNLSKKDRQNYSKIAKAYALTIEILKKRNHESSEFIKSYKAALERVEALRDEYYREARENAD